MLNKDVSRNGTLFLTSIGFSNQDTYDKFSELVLNPEKKSAVIVTTAAEEKENHKYSQLAFAQLSSIGFSKIDFTDLESEPKKDFSAYDVVYVCGGNTFKLLKYARAANFKESIMSLLARGGIYVGVSAGSLILGPSIKIAGEVQQDRNEVQITDLSGFSIINSVVSPHYSPDQEESLADFEKRENIKTERLPNNQAIVISGGSVERI